jgi:ABC-type glycerol-3-phosphate transport system substrate-binding protein
MMKKLIAGLLVVIMVLGLAACGSTGTKNSAEPTQAASSSAAPESTWNVVRPDGLPDDYPSKEITYIYPFGTGSMQDVYIRVLAEKIKEKEGWKNSIVVQQKEGASGDIGWTAFTESKPDGYTIGFAPTAMLITAIGESRPYTADNLEFIFNMMTDPGCIAVASGSAYSSLSDLLNAAKEKPGTISIGVTSTTGSEGLAVLQLEAASGAVFNVVPAVTATRSVSTSATAQPSYRTAPSSCSPPAIPSVLPLSPMSRPIRKAVMTSSKRTAAPSPPPKAPMRLSSSICPTASWQRRRIPT